MTASLKTILLQTSDGETFKLDEAVAIESQTIKQMIDGNCPDNTIPLPNITSKILSKVIKYCKRHASKNIDVLIEDDLKAFDAEFMKMDQRTLFDLIMAAYYLDIKSLIDLTCQTIADMLKGKSVEEIRMTLNIVYDRTPHEEEDIRKEYAWAF